MKTNPNFRGLSGMKIVNRRESSDQDPTIRSGKIAEGVPLAKLIPRELRCLPELVMLTQPRALSAERFRRLKTTLFHRHGDGTQIIVVTSGAPAEGKSTVAINLALAFAGDPDSNVLLIDSDMRRPAIGQMLDPAPKLGLREVLSKTAPLEHAVIELKNSPLKILPAGSRMEDPLELLGSQESGALFASLREQYRWIVVDSPPIVPFTDADALGALSDGILMVVRHGSTTEALYSQAISSVTSTRILGTVFNDAPKSFADTGKYYDGYYNAYYSKDDKR